MRLLLLMCAALAAAGQPRPAAPTPTLGLTFPALRVPQVPELNRRSLANGMKVHLWENRELPVATGILLVRAGPALDPPDKKGLAALAARLLRSGGALGWSADKIDSRLRELGAVVETRATQTRLQLTFSCLGEHLEEVLTLVQAMVTEPIFSTDALEAAQGDLRAAIGKRNDDPNNIVTRAFFEAVYGKDSPYGREPGYDDIDNIHREDVRAFHRNYFFPGNITLGVQGDFSPAELGRRIEQAFSTWPAAQNAPPVFPEPSREAGPALFLAASKRADRSNFVVGHLGGRLADADLPALLVASQLLTMRLRLRMQRHHYTGVSVDALWDARPGHLGTFQVRGSTGGPSTTGVLQAVRRELEELSAADFSEQEILAAKRTAVQQLVQETDRAPILFEQLVLDAFYELPPDRFPQTLRQITALTRSDLKGAISRRLRPAQLVVVTVGNPDFFLRPLSDLKLPEVAIDLTIPRPKPREAQTDPASLEQGRQWLARYRDAVGGADRLASIRDYTALFEGTLHTAGRPVRLSHRDIWVADETFRQDQNLPGAAATVFYNGKVAWAASGRAIGALRPEIVRQIRGEIFRLPFRLALSDRDPARTVSYMGSGVLHISDQSGNYVRLYLDEQTGLPSRASYQLERPNGEFVSVDESYSDWLAFEGVTMPGTISVKQNGRSYADYSVKEIKFNSGLELAEVEKKP